MIKCLFKPWSKVFGICVVLFLLCKAVVPETSWSVLVYVGAGTLIVPLVQWGLGKIINIQ